MRVRIYATDDGITRGAAAEDERGRQVWSEWGYGLHPIGTYLDAARQWAADHGHEVVATEPDFRRPIGMPAGR